MKTLALIAGALLCASAAPAYNPSSDWPPLKYRGQNIALVAFADDVEELCGAAPEGYVELACTIRKPGRPALMVLPNPDASMTDELFRRLASHELGHVNGWPADHPI